MYNCVSIKHFQYIITKEKIAIKELLPLSDIPSPHATPLSISGLILFLTAWVEWCLPSLHVIAGDCWMTLFQTSPVSTCKALWLLCLQMFLASRRNLSMSAQLKNKFLYFLVTVHTNGYLKYTSTTKQWECMCDLVSLWSVCQLKGQ